MEFNSGFKGLTGCLPFPCKIFEHSRRSSYPLGVSARSIHVGVSLHTMDTPKMKMMWCHYISGREDNFYKKKVTNSIRQNR